MEDPEARRAVRVPRGKRLTGPRSTAVVQSTPSADRILPRRPHRTCTEGLDRKTEVGLPFQPSPEVVPPCCEGRRYDLTNQTQWQEFCEAHYPQAFSAVFGMLGTQDLAELTIPRGYAEFHRVAPRLEPHAWHHQLTLEMRKAAAGVVVEKWLNMIQIMAGKTIRRRGCPSEEIEEVVQIACLALLASDGWTLESPSPGSLNGYLATSVANSHNMLHRPQLAAKRKGRQVPLEPELESLLTDDNAILPEEYAERSEAYHLVLAIIGELASPYGEILWHTLGGATYKQIGQNLGLSGDQVKDRKKRALKMVRERVTWYYHDTAPCGSRCDGRSPAEEERSND